MEQLIQEICADCGLQMNEILAGTHVRWKLCIHCEVYRKRIEIGRDMWWHRLVRWWRTR